MLKLHNIVFTLALGSFFSNNTPAEAISLGIGDGYRNYGYPYFNDGYYDSCPNCGAEFYYNDGYADRDDDDDDDND